MPKPASELINGDYDSIAAAVQETPRGRWFLTEYARRNRQADTQMLLSAIARLENVIRGEGLQPEGEKVRASLAAIAERITRTKKEIATARLDPGQPRTSGAADDLDSVLLATEGATSDILAAAERIQETAWTLREQGFKAEACDFLDAQATDIYTACSFQDLTSQQTRKIIDLLRHVDGRINTMIEVWGLDASAAAAPLVTVTDAPSLSHDTANPPLAGPPIETIAADAPPIVPADTAVTIPSAALDRADAGKPHCQRGDEAFSALNTLSAEEKIALFT
jgi:hypothetical protein